MLQPAPLPGMPIWGIAAMCLVGILMPTFWIIGIVAAFASGKSTIGGIFRLMRKHNRKVDADTIQNGMDQIDDFDFAADDGLSRLDAYTQ